MFRQSIDEPRATMNQRFKEREPEKRPPYEMLVNGQSLPKATRGRDTWIHTLAFPLFFPPAAGPLEQDPRGGESRRFVPCRLVPCGQQEKGGWRCLSPVTPDYKTSPTHPPESGPSNQPRSFARFLKDQAREQRQKALYKNNWCS